MSTPSIGGTVRTQAEGVATKPPVLVHLLPDRIQILPDSTAEVMF